MEACMGTKEERLAKFADPSRRQALKDNLPSTATAPIGTVTILLSFGQHRAVPRDVGISSCRTER